MNKTALLIVDMVKVLPTRRDWYSIPRTGRYFRRFEKSWINVGEHDCLVVFLQHCNRKDKEDPADLLHAPQLH